MTLTVENRPDDSRYALLKDGELIGVADYELRDDAIVFTHTEIQEDKRERGMASQLVQSALDDVLAGSDRRVVAGCPYVRRWLGDHPDYLPLTRRSA